MNQVIDSVPVQVHVTTPPPALHTFSAPPMDLSHILAKAPKADVMTAAQIASFAKPQGERNGRNALFALTHPILALSGGETIKTARVDANIKALKLSQALRKNDILPNPEQQAILASYTGWGGLSAPLMNSSVKTDLQQFVTDEELGQLRSGILNAHYTPPEVVKFLFDCVDRLGLKPLRILDPCTGIGGFFGHLPTEIAKNAELIGCELDYNSARIAKLLFPDAAIESTAFEKMKLPDAYFDLAIGNVPFGDYQVFDPETPNVRHLVHNAFFAKAMRKVKKGGLIAFITSTGTMDGLKEQTRRLLASECNLVAAFRMSNMVFSKIASTEVNSDVLIFQVRQAGEASNALEWIDISHDVLNDQPVVRNKWWANHPSALLGKPTVIRNKYGFKFGCSDKDYCAAMPSALLALKPLAFGDTAGSEVANWSQWMQTRHLGEKTEGSWVLEDNVLMRIGDGKLQAHNLSDLQASRVMGMLQISTALHELLSMQVLTTDDSRLIAPRGKANMLYDMFVAKHGPVNAAVNRRLFRRDPAWPLLAASELYDEETKVAIKSDIYTSRTVNPLVAPEKTSSPEQALAASIAYCLKVDADFMGQLMDKPGDEIIASLASAERIFWCPQDQEWQLRDIYLSGSLYQKIAAANQAMATDPRMVRNADALQLALPERVSIGDIEFQMGSTFIGIELITAFLHSVMGVTKESLIADMVKVKYFAGRGKWTVEGPRQHTSAAQTSYGTSRINFLDVVHKALNGANITIFDKVVDDDGVRTVPNELETGLAREKLFELKHAFDKWIRADETRFAVVEETFNRQFNSFKAPTFDGSHLVVPGLNANITLRGHQKNGIYRALIGGNMLAAHGVGAGKTLLAICAAQMRKQMGLCRTNLIAVPNHLLLQFSSEYMRAFPLAKLLLIGGKDMGENAASTLARIATGNYDTVICVHSAFSAIPMGLEDVKKWRQEIEAQLNADAGQATDVAESKSIERQKKIAGQLLDSYEARQKKNLLTWGEIGIDSLIIDESQAFKNLHFSTSLSNIAGLNTSFSLRAFDCFIKTRHVQLLNDDRGCVLFTTATPITNSVAEMFHLMRFLMLPKLRELGMEQFDQWRANFGKTVSQIEQLPEGGGFRLQTRFASFHNIPSLMELFWSFADVILREDLDLPVPLLKGGKAQVVEVDRTENQKAFMVELVARAQAIRGPKEHRPKPSDDNMLCVTTDGRKAALDMRLINPSFADEPGSKLNVAVSKVYNIWHETKEKRLTQMVFCDMGTPGGKTFCVYDDMRDKLIQMGVPAGEIAYAHDANTDARKEALWAKVRKGIVRILFGSTEKMGTGVNAQDLLVAKHDLDAPYRPDQIEQRDGRILRQGNSNDEVWIGRYVTRQTFDAYIWQILETKLRFILQVMSGKSRVRSMEDVDSRAMSFAEVKALATGNPRLIERAKLQQQESELMLKRRSHQNTVADASRNLRLAQSLAPLIEKQLVFAEKDVATLNAHPIAELEILGQKFAGENLRTDGGKALASVTSRVLALDMRSGIHKVGTFRGMNLELHVMVKVTQLNVRFDMEMVLRGAHQWGTPAGESALGNIVRLVNLAELVQTKELGALTGRLAAQRADIDQLQKVLDVPFGYARELQEVCTSRKLLEIELGIAEEDNSGMQEEDSDTATTE